MAVPPTASAAIVPSMGGVSGTGMAAPGVPLPGGAIDTHWGYGFSSSLAMPGSMSSAASVIPTLPSGWVANTPTSQWIQPAVNNPSAGYYFYQTSFDLTGMNLNDIQLQFRMTGDDEIACVLVNDWITPYTANNLPGNPVHGRWSDLITIDNNDRPGATPSFLQGLNTLTFVVHNHAAGDTGLQVQIYGPIPNNVSNPEPMTLALFGALSVAGMVGARRMRKA